MIQPPDAVEAMRLAYNRCTSMWITDDVAHRLLGHGWTSEVLDLIRFCAEHAVEHDTYLSRIHTGRDMREQDPERAVTQVAWRLSHSLEKWAEERTHLRSIFAWAPTIAADRGNSYPLLQPSGPGRPSSLRAVWTRFVGYELGPLAYAAGLPLGEARRAASANALQPESLRALAALRGFVLPATPSSSVG